MEFIEASVQKDRGFVCLVCNGFHASGEGLFVLACVGFHTSSDLGAQLGRELGRKSGRGLFYERLHGGVIHDETVVVLVRFL